LLNIRIFREINHRLDPGPFGIIHRNHREEYKVDHPEKYPASPEEASVLLPEPGAIDELVPSHNTEQDEKGEKGQNKALLFVREVGMKSKKEHGRNEQKGIFSPVPEESEKEKKAYGRN